MLNTLFFTCVQKKLINHPTHRIFLTMMTTTARVCSLIVYLFLVAVCSGSTSYYSLLGISKKSTLKEVKAAYRKKAKETHPDKNLDADGEETAKKFREVTFRVTSTTSSMCPQHHNLISTTTYCLVDLYNDLKGCRSI